MRRAQIIWWAEKNIHNIIIISKNYFSDCNDKKFREKSFAANISNTKLQNESRNTPYSVEYADLITISTCNKCSLSRQVQLEIEIGAKYMEN